jgi:hypothetical protein
VGVEFRGPVAVEQPTECQAEEPTAEQRPSLLLIVPTQSRTGAEQQRLDGGDRGVHKYRDLVVAKPHELAVVQHVAVPVRQRLPRRGEDRIGIERVGVDYTLVGQVTG